MSQTFQLRAIALPQKAIDAHTRCGLLVWRVRREIQEQNIYQRPPTNRPLSGRLKAGESYMVQGPFFFFVNPAPYARKRHSLTGFSQKDGHSLEAFWASRSIPATQVWRAKIMRDAVARVWSIQV